VDTFPSLREVILALDPFERQRISSIRIAPGSGGYLATISISAMLPLGESSEHLPEGIQLLGAEGYPPIERIIDWRIDPWEQILEVIHDPYLSQSSELGNMEAAELLRDQGKSWIISTHGHARSAERKAWLSINS
jgi:hypothetical protein